MLCGHIKDSYQPGHLPSLIKVFNGEIGDKWIAENQMFLGYKIFNTRSAAYDYFSSKAFSFV